MRGPIHATMRPVMTSERDYPARPLAGVGAIVWKDDAVLLVKRGREPLKGRWNVPGGLQELGETTREAACREVREETGIEIDIIHLAGTLDVIRRDGRNRVQNQYTLIDYGAEWRSGEAIPGDDAVEARWVPLDEIADYDVMPDTVRLIQESARKRRG